MLSPALVVAGVIVPLVFALAVWSLVRAVQGLVAGEPLPPHRVGMQPARAREIRKTVRYLEYHLREAAYRYERGTPSRVPRLWLSDVQRRTN